MRAKEDIIKDEQVPQEPVKDELWALQGWLRNLRQGAYKIRTQLKAIMIEEKLVLNIIKMWKKTK